MDSKFPYTKRSILAAAIMMACGGGAYAQGATDQLPEFQELDKDRSSYIEPREAEQTIEQQQFVSADSDNDRRLSENEYDQLKRGQGSMAQQQDGQQQMQAQKDQGQDGADIVVQEQPSQVQVEQEPPKVTVQQKPPEITVVQPEPKVSIEQPQPDVRIEQAKPDVQIEQQGEPQVAIQEGGEPEVEYRRQAQQDQQQQQQDQQQASGQSIQDKTIEDLSGMSVVASNGENIGDIEKIVRSTTDSQLYAVVAGGGFLGIGEDRAAVPLDELSLQQDQLIWQQASSQDALERYGYDEQQFADIQQENATVAELSGQAGAGGQTQMSFQQLDQDSSGSISQNEAQQLPELQQQWSQADQDNSGQIDQSEFSAFEQQMMESPQGGGAQQGGDTPDTQGGQSR